MPPPPRRPSGSCWCCGCEGRGTVPPRPSCPRSWTPSIGFSSSPLSDLLLYGRRRRRRRRKKTAAGSQSGKLRYPGLGARFIAGERSEQRCPRAGRVGAARESLRQPNPWAPRAHRPSAQPLHPRWAGSKRGRRCPPVRCNRCPPPRISSFARQRIWIHSGPAERTPSWPAATCAVPSFTRVLCGYCTLSISLLYCFY